MTNPLARAALAALLVLTSAGCSWFRPSAARADAALVRENSDLRLERRLLQEELTLVRREQEVLRRALDSRSSTGIGASERERQLAQDLESTRRELDALRSRYAAISAGASSDPMAAVRQRETEERLAAAMRDLTSLQQENTRLRGEITSVRNENEQLARRALEAEETLGALNLELVAQREAMSNARQEVSALRAQLQMVIATNGAGAGNARQPAAASTDGLSAATLSARLNPDGTVTTSRAGATEPAGPPRKHKVQTGETLASIAYEYYGSVERWRDIYAANSELLRDNRPLSAGMELIVP